MSYAFVYQYNHNQLLMVVAAEVECLSRSFVSVGKTEGISQNFIQRTCIAAALRIRTSFTTPQRSSVVRHILESRCNMWLSMQRRSITAGT